MKRAAFLFALLPLLLTACLFGGSDRNPVASSAGPAPTLQPVKKVLSMFNPIKGTDYLMASLIATPEERPSSFNPMELLSSGYSYSSNTYNYVFFNLKTEQYHRLLPANEYVIYQTSGFPILQYDPANPDQPAPTVEWWLYSVIKKDTNGNGYLDGEDALTVGLSDVGGNGYTELIENVDAVLSQIYRDSSALFIIYRADKKNHIAKINPSTREVLSTTEMDLGEDVK